MSIKKAIASNEVEDVMEVPLDEPPMSQVVWIKEEDAEEVEEADNYDELPDEKTDHGSPSHDPSACEICTKHSQFRDQAPQRRPSGEKARCPHCKVVFLAAALKTHIHVQHKGGGVGCEICHRRYANSNGLKEHMLSHGEKSFKCSHCPSSFYSKQKLNQHSIIHSQELPHQCRFCKAAFRYKDTLLSHEALHTGKNHECKLCHKLFAAENLLRKHLSRHEQQGKEKSYECKTCEQTFDHISKLKAHEELHAEEGLSMKEKVEMRAKKAAERKARMEARIPSSSGIGSKSSFTCKYCGKIRFDAEKLKKHLMSHEGYKCSVCGAMFEEKKKLKDHLEKSHEKV